MDMKAFHKEVMSMQNRLKAYLDKPNDPIARSIQHTFQKLEDEVQIGKSNGTIRNRIKEIEMQIKPALNSGVMSHDHCLEIENWARNYQQKIR